MVDCSTIIIAGKSGDLFTSGELSVGQSCAANDPSLAGNFSKFIILDELARC